MKHVFIIHSHTVFLTSLGVINDVGLNNDDIIFVYGRNYSQNIIKLPFKCFNLSHIYEASKSIILSISRRTLINYSKVNDVTEKIDKFIDDEVGGDFEVYLSHLSSPFFQLFATSPLCKKCHFVQEGGRVMVKVLHGEDPFVIKLYNWLFLKNNKRLWRTNKWLISNHRDYLPYNVDAYAIDSNFWGDLDIKVMIVKWPVIKDLPIDINPQYPIFVLDGYIEQGAIQKDDYMQAIKKMVKEDAQKVNYIKFHPNQKQENVECILKFFKENESSVVIIDNNIPFELVLTKYKHLKVYGYGSSLLIFAKALGHIVKAREWDLLESKSYRKYFRRNIGPICDSLVLS